MAFLLSIDNPRGETERILVRRTSVMLGRGDDNDVILRTPLASRQHCRLFSAAGRMMIEDLDSQNGTYVVEERIMGARELMVGETVRVPGYVFRLEADGLKDDGGGTVVSKQTKTPVAYDRVLSEEGFEKEDAATTPALKGFSPLVSYGEKDAADALMGREDPAFAHRATEAVMRPGFVSDHIQTAQEEPDTDPDGFDDDKEKTDPSREVDQPVGAHSVRSSSNAGVPVDARELRASLFTLFQRAVQRTPPTGKDGRQKLREQIAQAIPREDDRLTYLETQAWAAEIAEELCGYGPLTPLLANPNVTSVVVEDTASIRIQRGGQLVPVGSAFTSTDAMEAVTQRLLVEAGTIPAPVDKTETYRLPSGLEVVVHKPRGEITPFTVVKPKGPGAAKLEERLHKRAEEVANAATKL